MIIVTGGAGFIGSNLVATLLERGHQDIVVCDHLEREEKKKNIEKHNIKEVITPESLPSYLKECGNIDVIFHMGAISSTVETNINLITDTNFRLSLNLWHWCVENNCKFLYASSAATYGDGEKGFIDDDSIKHLASLKPMNPYGRSKNLFDRKAAHLVKHNITPRQWAGYKFFNVYGPNEYHKDGQKSVVCQMFQQVKDTGKVRLFKSYKPNCKDGDQLRDFVYVKDCCDVMLWFLENEQINGIFNIGTGKAQSFNNLAIALFSSLNISNPEIEYFDMPEQVKEKYQYFTEADLDKLHKAGYDKLFTSLEDGIADYVRNYLNTEDPYR